MFYSSLNLDYRVNYKSNTTVTVQGLYTRSLRLDGSVQTPNPAECPSILLLGFLQRSRDCGSSFFGWRNLQSERPLLSSLTVLSSLFSMLSKWNSLVALHIWLPEWQHLSDKPKHIFSPELLKKTLFQMELWIAVNECFVTATVFPSHTYTCTQRTPFSLVHHTHTHRWSQIIGTLNINADVALGCRDVEWSVQHTEF